MKKRSDFHFIQHCAALFDTKTIYRLEVSVF